MMINFDNCRIFIFGDIMLDKYYMGRVDRISPEAPVPVVLIENIQTKLGGASNVANNIVAMGGQAVLCGRIGMDSLGNEVEQLSRNAGITTALVKSRVPTITKARVIGGKQQIVRLDYEEVVPVETVNESRYMEKAHTLIPTVDVVVLSDYGKGLVTPAIAQQLIRECNDAGKKMIIDPKGKCWDKYSGAWMVTPNMKELSDVVGRQVENSDEAITGAAREVLEKYGIHCLLVTRSEKGMSFINQERTVHIPTHVKEVFDVSGAGDTVVATIACAIAAGVELEEALHMANVAAGVVVSKVGTATLSITELNNALSE